MKDLQTQLTFLIEAINIRLRLLRRQAKDLGLPVVKLQNFRNALARFGDVTDFLSKNPPVSGRELRITVAQMDKIQEALGTAASQVVEMVADNSISLASDEVFTDWVESLIEDMHIPAAQIPQQNVWVTGPLN